MLRLLETLGIAVDRETEVYHNCCMEPGLHHYGGWFHFIDTIVTGADAARTIAPNVRTFDLETATDRFKIGFTTRVGLLNPLFHGQPVVQIEFQAIVPWVLLKPEPEPTH